MEDFITRMDIPKNEPVILGGDFNVESITGEYITMLSNLQASKPRHVSKNGIVSYYPEGNDFVSSGGISDDLDYILVSLIISQVLVGSPRSTLSKVGTHLSQFRRTQTSGISPIISQSLPI
mmetsp:Transcript_18222/g.20617  ORF Transcript_18222/g.20617 Transcript_18222/m.20617 type:complete len:121 (+) Transcript_18222:371-733(+)